MNLKYIIIFLLSLIVANYLNLNIPRNLAAQELDSLESYTNISEIQGRSHISPYLNQQIKTRGIVTGVKENGFYLQNAMGDKDDSTSEGIFVFTESQPEVKTGDAVKIQGKISEYTPKENNLSVTTLFPREISVLSTDNPLPSAVIIGVEGRQSPTEIIDDDRLTIFDPERDGIDFWESLEGMRVMVKKAIAVSPLNEFGEIFTVEDRGLNATGLSPRQTMVISEADFNPERIQLQQDKNLSPEIFPSTKVGDYLGDVTGIMSYDFGNYEILVTEAITVTPGELQPQTTTLIPTETSLTIASYNVLNLDPNDDDGDRDIEDGQFKALAYRIVNNLHSPDIIALQEIQDNSGSEDDGVVDASLTYQTLIAEIEAISGINYQFIDIPPENNQDGGQPGGNIRVGYIYNPERVNLIVDSTTRIEDIAFNHSRKSLVAKFQFNNEELILINNHLSSKGGSSPLFGKIQPPINGDESARINQAKVINNYVSNLLKNNQDSQIIVLGDFNEFEFNQPLTILTKNGLVNLTETLPKDNRYSYIYQGNAQTIDHIFVSKNIVDQVDYEQVHVNVEFSDSTSDHDPIIVIYSV